MTVSNFQFLYPEFKALLEPAKSAEQLVHADPRACCMRTRHALEQAVHWLYAHDRDLRMPYDRSLNTLLTIADFERLVRLGWARLSHATVSQVALGAW